MIPLVFIALLLAAISVHAAVQSKEATCQANGITLKGCILEHFFCVAFDLQGTPLRIEFKTGKNPFEGKKRELTESEQRAARRARIRGRKLYG